MMKKGNVINLIINIILTCLYAGLSFFGFFMLMGTESVMYEALSFEVVWTYIFSYTGFFMFAICIGSMVLSYFLYKKKHIIYSYIVRFIPIYICVALLLTDLAVNYFI